MIHRMLAGGLVAGFAAGLLAALLHFAFLQKIILLAEEYERGAVVHFAGGGEASHGAEHDHDTGHAAPSGDGGGLSRNALTVLFTGLTYASYGLVLVAGFALAEHFGHRIDAREGMLWGLGAFMAVQLAPAMGLPPELPGTISADLTDRQIWYFGTVLATGLGLALIASSRGVMAAFLGGALIAGPHVIGAPHLEVFYGVAPPELAAEFAARALGVGFVTWAALGWLAGRFWTGSAA